MELPAPILLSGRRMDFGLPVPRALVAGDVLPRLAQVTDVEISSSDNETLDLVWTEPAEVPVRIEARIYTELGALVETVSDAESPLQFQVQAGNFFARIVNKGEPGVSRDSLVYQTGLQFVAAAPIAPVNLTSPVIVSSGDLANPVVGDVLSVSVPGTYSGDSAVLSYEYRRVSDDAAAAGAGAGSDPYTIDAGDGGEALYVHETATNAGGTASADSNASGTVEAEGTYSMAFDPETFTIAPEDDQVVTVTLTQLTGSPQMITLSLPDLPDGWAGDFSNNPISSDGGTSDITLTAPAA